MSDIIFKIRSEISSNVDEAFRVLKTSMQYYSIEKNLKKFVITSSGHGEGKTSTAINLCISYAKSGQKVILVDADLQKPGLVKHLGNTNFIGLTNYIAGKAELEEIIINSSIENFHFINSGPKPVNTQDVLSSPKFMDMLQAIEKRYDVIIIDSPSVGKHIDAAIIAAKVDGAVLVIKSNQSDYRQIKTAKEQLERLGGKIIGVVLNKMDKSYYKLYTNHFDDHGFFRKFKKGWFKKIKVSGR